MASKSTNFPNQDKNNEDTTKTKKENNIVKEIRDKQIAIDELTVALERKSKEILFIQESIAIEEERLREEKEEYNIRFKDYQKTLTEIDNLENNGSNFSLNEMIKLRKETAENEISKQLKERITQLDKVYKGSLNKNDQIYYQLIFENIQVKYKNKNLSFIINKHTTFSLVKHQVIEFFKIDENPSLYIFTNEINALIMTEEQSIDNYLRDYSINNNQFFLDYLPNLMDLKSLTPLQDSRISDNFKSNKRIGNKNKVEQNSNFDFTQNEIKNFTSDFSLIKYFQLDEKKSKLLEKEKTSLQRAKNIETSFLMLLMLIIYYLLTLISIYYNRDVQRTSVAYNYIQDIFDNSNVKDHNSLFQYLSENIGFVFLSKNLTKIDTNKYKLINSKTFKQIGYYLDLPKLESDFPNLKSLYDKAESYKQTKFNNFQLMSSLRFILKRVKIRDCTDVYQSISTFRLSEEIGCFESQYTEKTKDQIGVADEASTNLDEFKTHTKYISAKQSNVSLNFDSLVGKIDGSGFHSKIPSSAELLFFLTDLISMIPAHPNFQNLNPLPGYSEVNNEYNLYLVYYNKRVRELSLVFTLFLPSNEFYYNVDISFSYLPTGFLYPNKIKVDEFIIHFYKYISNIICDAIRFLMSCVIIWFVLLDFIKYPAEKKFDFFKQTSKLCILVIPTIFFLIFFIRIATINTNTNDENFSYVDLDFYKYSYNFDNSELLECFFLIIITFYIIYFLRLNSSVGFVFKNLFDFFKISLLYGLFFVPVIILFTTIQYVIFCNKFSEISNFSLAYINTILLPIGGMNISEWIKINEFWAVLFTVSYYFFILYMLVTVFIALFTQSYRNNIISKGHVSDKQQISWNSSDYISWMFFGLNNKESN